MNEALMNNFDKMVMKDTVAVIHATMKNSEGKYVSNPHTVALVHVDKNLTDIEKCEKAFMLTNSIENGWWNNKEVTAMFPEKGCRSTNVGDHVLIGNTKYLCANFGWEKI